MVVPANPPITADVSLTVQVLTVREDPIATPYGLSFQYVY
jgi:hypothetical protein